MTLLSPVFLWAFAALVPLAAAYWLKVRPTRRPATALFLWEQVFTQKKATRLFHRLRDLWSLLLMMLALSALVLALAQPALSGDERKDLLILIDHSASMSARDGGSTRLDRAKDEARAVIRALNGQQRAAVAVAADGIAYRAHLTNDPRRLMEAIDAIAPTATPLRVRALGELAQRTGWADRARVLLISDGCLGGAALPEGIELLKVGTPQPNAGIVACDLQRDPAGEGGLMLYVRLASSHKAAIEADLLVRHEEAVVRVLPVTVGPGANPSQVFALEGGPGRWTVTLDVEDALDADDHAYLALAEAKPVRVAVQAQDRYFFEHSVLAFGRSSDLFELVRETPDVVLSQGAAGAAALNVVFAPSGDSGLWPGLGEPVGPVVPRVREAEHPALRFVDAAAMTFEGARRVEAPPGAAVLVESDQGLPLIWQVRTPERTSVVVNLDPAASELFFSTHFPVLVHGLVTHLARRTETLAVSYQPGQIAPVPGVGEGEPTRVIPPVGEPYTLEAATLGPLRSPGFYRMRNAGGDWLTAATLAATNETLLDNTAALSTHRPLSRGWPPASLLVLLAVAVLVGESLLYHRRKVG